MVVSRCSSTICRKDYLCSIALPLLLTQRSVGYIYVGLFLGSKGERVLMWGFPSAPRMPGPVRKDTSGGRQECRGLAQGPRMPGSELYLNEIPFHSSIFLRLFYNVRNTKLDRSFGLILGLKKYHCRFKECLQTWSSSAVTTPQT